MSAVRKPARARRGRPPHDDVLTPAEWAIVHAVRHGQSYASIATRRGISRDAVKYHVRNSLEKLGLKGRRVRVVPLGSGHHFGGSYERLVELILGPTTNH